MPTLLQTLKPTFFLIPEIEPVRRYVRKLRFCFPSPMEVEWIGWSKSSRMPPYCTQVCFIQIYALSLIIRTRRALVIKKFLDNKNGENHLDRNYPLHLPDLLLSSALRSLESEGLRSFLLDESDFGFKSRHFDGTGYFPSGYIEHGNVTAYGHLNY